MDKFTCADAVKLPFDDRYFDMVIGSPPYLGARTYGIGADRGLEEWIGWMLDVTVEALRVCVGPVLWVCAGTGASGYLPGPEGLVYRAQKAGIPTLRPCVWVSNKPPAIKTWFTNTWEYVVAFGEVPYFDATQLSTPMKYTNGGAFRQRSRNGPRKKGSSYPQHKDRRTVPNDFGTPELNDKDAWIGNLLRVPVGGGRMGHPLAHETEAPFPEGVVEPFIRTLCPPGGRVLDVFSGSGTTVAVAEKLGRVGYGVDIRESQCRLGERRLADIAPGLTDAAAARSTSPRSDKRA
jgi:DNA modification methylase